MIQTEHPLVDIHGQGVGMGSDRTRDRGHVNRSQGQTQREQCPSHTETKHRLIPRRDQFS